MEAKKIMVTGITGFLGSHIALKLLQQGYDVTGTLRTESRMDQIRDILKQNSADLSCLDLVEADLLDEAVWKRITKGMDHIVHVASPIPRILPKDDRQIIKTAREGTLNVLKAAMDNEVKRVVMTSSVGAILYGKNKNERSGTFDENDWTDARNKKDTTPYYRSKTIAEKAAWDLIDRSESLTELVTICPGTILGPVLEKDFGTSANLVIKMLDGSAPALPKAGYEIVDVRSVADLHILAMEHPNAAGERFLCTSGYLRFREIAAILKEAYPERKIPRLTLPNFAVRLFAMIDRAVEPVLLDMGVERKANASKARQMLGWNDLSVEKAVIDCAESVIELEIIT